MKTQNTLTPFPTEQEKQNEFLRIQRYIEANRVTDLPSWLRYTFQKSHDGITVTPINANHFAYNELSSLIQFCSDSGYSFGVHVKPGATAPSFEINMCRD